MKEKRIFINGVKTNYTVKEDGTILSLNYARKNIKKALIPCKSDNGYYYVNIYINHVLHRKSIHRLVATAFIDNPENKPEVNHKDGDKSNNKVSNLEWSTEKENTKHAIQNNLRKVHYGENATDAKIDNNTAEMICILLEENELGTKEIANKMNVTFAIVSNIKHKKAWTHISDKYDVESHNVKSKPIKTKKKKPEKISERNAILICELLQNTTLSINEISEKTSVSKYKINSILYGNAWRYISSKYDFSKRRKR